MIMRAAPASDEWLRVVYNALACAVVVLDRTGAVIEVNDAARRLLGPHLDGIVPPGRSARVVRVSREDGTVLPARDYPAHVALRTRKPCRGVVVGVPGADGRHCWLQLDATPLLDGDGLSTHVVVSAIDVTERVERARRAAESGRHIRTSEQDYRHFFAQATDAILIFDPVGEIVLEVNNRACVMYGLPRDLFIGKSLLDLSCDASRAESYLPAVLSDRSRQEFESVHLRADGTPFDVYITATPMELQGRQVILTINRDISEVKRATRALGESEARTRAILEAALDAIITVDHQGRIGEFNPAAEHLFGYTRAEAIGQEVSQLIVPPARQARHATGLRQYLHTAQSSVVGRRVEGLAMRRDGTEFPVEVTTTRIPGVEPPSFVGYIRDITERKQAEDMLRRQALHDALTDLPNRILLRDRLQQAILTAQRDSHPLALLLLDLDRFKEINDTFSHYHGDVLLQQVAERLRGTLRAADTVARLGGDEFALLLPGNDRDGATVAADKIRAVLDAPFAVEGQDVHIGCSVGIALCPAHGDDGETLLRRADVAMYVAKRTGSRQAVYAPELDDYSPERLAFIADLRQATTHGTLLLHYQPKVDLVSSRIHGVEALLRWPHSERGLVRPDQFITLSEQTGLITPLTLWVIDAALGQCKSWRDNGLRLDIAVNLSVVNLHDPRLPDIVASLLDAHDLPPACLRLEVTETAVMANAACALDVLNRLDALGVNLSVDDFGTGYSSLSYLKRLPVDEIKIDKSFVLPMTEIDADAVIVRSTIEMGHRLGLHVVAEGVENRDTLDLLASLGCDAAQGYFVTRPLPATELEAWLRQESGQWRVADR